MGICALTCRLNRPGRWPKVEVESPQVEAQSQLQIVSLWGQHPLHRTRTSSPALKHHNGCKATWKREFQISRREAGPPNHHDDQVDLDARGARNWGRAQILDEKTLNLKKSGNEFHYTIFLILLVTIMLCSQLHCQILFRLKRFLCKIDGGSAVPEPLEANHAKRFISQSLDHCPGNTPEVSNWSRHNPLSGLLTHTFGVCVSMIQ